MVKTFMKSVKKKCDICIIPEFRICTPGSKWKLKIIRNWCIRVRKTVIQPTLMNITCVVYPEHGKAWK
jgi:hypothetical protein